MSGEASKPKKAKKAKASKGGDKQARVRRNCLRRRSNACRPIAARADAARAAQPTEAHLETAFGALASHGRITVASLLQASRTLGLSYSHDEAHDMVALFAADGVLTRARFADVVRETRARVP